MAKKQLNGKSKLSSTAQPDTTHEASPEPSLSLVRKKAPPARGKSFRLRQRDIDKLDTIREEVNDLAQDRIFNDADIIRGLLELGSKTNAKRLLKAVMDAR